MAESIRDDAKLKNKLRFIITTQVLIEEVGLENISIRKIAERAGFHNSTLYLYFKDVDYLIKLASMDYLEEYSLSLSKLSRKKLSPIEAFMEIWQEFCRMAFRQPDIFYQFFFGKYSDNLTQVMTEYYGLFPQKKNEFSKEIEDMFYGKSIYDRCLRTLIPLMNIGNLRINEDTLHLANSVIVSYIKEVLYQKCRHPELDSEDLTERALSALKYIIGY